MECGISNPESRKSDEHLSDSEDSLYEALSDSLYSAYHKQFHYNSIPPKTNYDLCGFLQWKGNPGVKWQKSDIKKVTLCPVFDLCSVYALM